LTQYAEEIDVHHSQTITFSFHSPGDVFTVPDGSVWLITGATDYSEVYGRQDVVIYQSSSSTPDPNYGERAEYFQVGEEMHLAFYVKPLHLNASQPEAGIFNVQWEVEILTSHPQSSPSTG